MIFDYTFITILYSKVNMSNKSFVKAVTKASEMIDNAMEKTSFTIVSTPIVTKTRKLKVNWRLKEGKTINGVGTERHYYEYIIMDNDITRFYARCSVSPKKWSERSTLTVMNFLRKKLSKDDSGYTILKEGSNFFDVIPTTKLQEINI